MLILHTWQVHSLYLLSYLKVRLKPPLSNQVTSLHIPWHPSDKSIPSIRDKQLDHTPSHQKEQGRSSWQLILHSLAGLKPISVDHPHTAIWECQSTLSLAPTSGFWFLSQSQYESPFGSWRNSSVVRGTFAVSEDPTGTHMVHYIPTNIHSHNTKYCFKVNHMKPVFLGVISLRRKERHFLLEALLL